MTQIGLPRSLRQIQSVFFITRNKFEHMFLTLVFSYLNIHVQNNTYTLIFRLLFACYILIHIFFFYLMHDEDANSNTFHYILAFNIHTYIVTLHILFYLLIYIFTIGIPFYLLTYYYTSYC